MTRELRARWLALATTVMVVLLAALFAWLRNLPPASPPQKTAVDSTAPTPDSGGQAGGVAAGRAAFERMNCTGCHGAEGRGSASLPLDGVGARLDREQLRAYSFALGGAAAELPPAVGGIKRARAGDPEVEALLDYLQQLR
jgi:mono/diheme cytochrome c family protein